MNDSTTDTSAAAFIILSGLLILAGFAVVSGVGGFVLLAVFLSLFGKSALSFWAAFLVLPALWTTLFILGWRWYGQAALWLLLVAPFAFYQLVLLLAGVFGR